MCTKQLTQKVIDFEFSRIQMKDEYHHHFIDDKPETQRYSSWNLNNIINGLGLGAQPGCSIMWVGFHENSYIDAYIYCLFKGCRNDDIHNGTFIKLKFHMYQLAAKFLKFADQRAIVEALSAAQHARKLSQYLNRNRDIYNIFANILKAYLESIDSQYQQQMEDLREFSKVFNFIQFQTITPYVGVLHHVNEKYYIINQKNCYFIVEHQPARLDFLTKMDSSTKGMMTVVNELDQKKMYEYVAPPFIANGAIKTRNKRRMQMKSIEPERWASKSPDLVKETERGTVGDRVKKQSKDKDKYHEKEKEKCKDKHKDKDKLKEKEKKHERESDRSKERTNLSSKYRQKLAHSYRPSDRKQIQLRATIHQISKPVTETAESIIENPNNMQIRTFSTSVGNRIKTDIMSTGLLEGEQNIGFDENDNDTEQTHKKSDPSLQLPPESIKNPRLTFVPLVASTGFANRNSCKQLHRKNQSPRDINNYSYNQTKNGTGIGIGIGNFISLPTNQQTRVP